ncbi:permease prefix domain 1-containing protein [Neobacillus dielmonensis]|uniref:permease prefix domain 1-containing protein n=1 Tax=Neobacillus dielmonensis TaxID=1347369 RepID=UPI0006935249|nr:permease prefix domain 1-containing protein [Neobacillus dielmonensis]
MKQIDKYVNSIYKNVAGDKQEIEDLRQEMRSHLVEAVEELKSKGKTEEEAIRIAIENFGGKNQIIQGLSEFFKVQKRFSNYVLSFALIFLVFGIFFLINSFSDGKEFNKEFKHLEAVEQDKGDIMNEAFDVLNASEKVTENEKSQLQDIFKKYNKQLNLLAVFPVSGSEDWLKENAVVRDKPTNVYPIAYNKAAIVIGDEGVVNNKEQIVPSDYDLGTVIKANEHWIVQYEYKSSYEKTVEKYHQLKYYGPSVWSVYQLPILFFALFIVLGLIWFFLNRQNRRLKGIMS